MRRLIACLTALAVAAPLACVPQAVRAQGGEPPHAWLFGTWTGGLFPPPTSFNLQACLGQPVVIFTRDVVLRATLTEPTFAQRVVVTARTSPGSTEFQFSPGATADAAAGLLGITAPQPVPGFGCETPNVLHVQRRGENEISFPGCADFPYPLVRCTH